MRRASRLGRVLIFSPSQSFGRFGAVLFLGAAAWFAWNFVAGEEKRLAGAALIALGFWSCWKVSLKPLEVREHRLVVPSALLSWSSIQDYRWLKTDATRTAHTFANPAPMLYVRAEDHDPLQAVLQD